MSRCPTRSNRSAAVSRADEQDARDRTLAPSPRRDRWSTIERDLRRSVGPLIAGIDEVGRGPLAGPVVACAVIMPPEERVIRGVDDSKQLSADARARLAAKIRARALAVRYPGYRWERNVGYSTAAHFAGIAERGVTPHHRHSFLPVRQLGLPFDAVGVDDEIALNVTGEAPCLTSDHTLTDNPPASSSPLTSEL